MLCLTYSLLFRSLVGARTGLGYMIGVLAESAIDRGKEIQYTMDL